MKAPSSNSCVSLSVKQHGYFYHNHTEPECCTFKMNPEKRHFKYKYMEVVDGAGVRNVCSLRAMCELNSEASANQNYRTYIMWCMRDCENIDTSVL